MAAKAETKPFAERVLTLTRVFDAPRALVFKAWTEPQRLARWWGPKGFTNPVCEMDVRPGGALRIVMRAPGGSEYPMTGVFREIVPPERLVFTNVAVDKAGKPLLEGFTTVTFAEEGGKTTLVLKARAVAVVADAVRFLDGMEEGWAQSLERLGNAVSATVAHGSFVIERVFEASPARVFRAWADAGAKARWFYGPEGWKEVVRELDFRVGGRERVQGAFANGIVSAFDAIYHDIVPDRRIVYAYDMRINERHISVSLATVELAPAGYGTRMTFTEQGVFLDGYDDAGSRERGSQGLIDKLEASLRS